MSEERKTISVTFLRYPGDPVTSERTLLAIALLTLGVLTVPPEPFVQTMDDVEGRVVFTNLWTFEPKSRDGLHETGKLIQHWDDTGWLLAHPEHPFAILRRGLVDPTWLVHLPPDDGPESARHYLATALDNLLRWRPALAAVIPRIPVTEGTRTVYIPADATPEQHARCLAILQQK